MKKVSFALMVVVAFTAAVTACDDRNPTSADHVSPPRTYSLTGVVTEPTDVAVEGATVRVVDGTYMGKSSVTDSGGHYTLIGVDGTFNVQVEKDGYASTTKAVTVPQTLALDLEITPLPISGNIAGDWTVVFEPHSSCGPSPLNEARTYRASIVQQGAQLSIALSGAAFVTPPQLSGTIHDLNVSIDLPMGCTSYCYYYYADTGPPAVIEDRGGIGFLAIWGGIVATVGRSGISGTLDGTFALMRQPNQPFNIIAGCELSGHRVTFKR
jgi:hypothetical protein